MSKAANPTEEALDEAFQEHLNAIARYCEGRVEEALQGSRTGDQIVPLMRHLYEVADYEIGQSPGHADKSHLVSCDRETWATIPEAIAVAEWLKGNLSADAMASLIHRIELPSDDCPFCIDGSCLAYPVRPLLYRLAPSIRWQRANFGQGDAPIHLVQQDAVVHAIEHGLRVGLGFEGLDSEQVNLAKAVLNILLAPSFAQEYLAGKPLPENLKVRIANDPIQRFNVSEGAQPAFRPQNLLGEPTGYVNSATEKSLREYYDLALNHGQFREALDTLRLGGAAQEIAKIIVPRVYDTEDEIQEWRSHFVSAMRAFAEEDFEPAEAFNALSMHRTASLAYQGLDDREIMEEHARIMGEVTRRAFPALCEPLPPRRDGRIRVGYLSANMHGSNGCRWSHGWLKNHGENIETFALNVGTVEDKISRQFRESAHHYFHLIRSIPDNARFIRGLDLDFLIITDIGLHGFNTSYATMRLARKQATAWGHPVTSGYPTIDFYLSSELMEPEGAQAQYTEELILLPNSGLCYSKIEDFPSRDRAYFGLPDTGPIIVNVQTKPKLLPQHDWMCREISERAKAPIVLLEGFQPCDTLVTKRRMERAGVRTHWLPHLNRQDFLALLQLADVSLDPPLWSGGNTTVEALALGTPVVTLPGPFMRGRHSYAFLKLAQAEGLIANGEQDFVELACDWQRQQEAARDINVENLFEDLAPVKALDQFIEKTLS
jgi:predicted O-linked N-acetylglucosamine transferase (SPINDLY family)